MLHGEYFENWGVVDHDGPACLGLHEVVVNQLLQDVWWTGEQSDAIVSL